MSETRLVLASTSVYRRSLLERVGVSFSVEAPLFDEESFKTAGKPPSFLVTLLAREKALSLRARHPYAHIMGSDQGVDLDGELLGKPGSEEGAVQQLLRMRGRRHRLLTAVTLSCPDGELLAHLDVHTLTMRALSEAEIRRYVQRDQPLDCAGGYKIEQAGITLFEQIEGEDFSAIMGLPLIAVVSMLRSRQFSVP